MCYLDKFSISCNTRNVGRFHYSPVHAFGCEIFADGVSKEERIIWGHLEVKALTVFENIMLKNKLEIKFTKL